MEKKLSDASMSRQGALDGWNPKELSILSAKAYAAIAVMLNQIGQGGKWPGSTTHARVAYPQKEGVDHKRSNELSATHDSSAVVSGMGNVEVGRHGGMGQVPAVG